MAQQFIKKVGVTPLDEGVHGQIIDSMSATTDKTTNAPSIRMALSNGVPAGSVIDYEGETVPDGYIRRDDIPTLSELNDNLTALLNKVSYQSVDISTATKYSDVEDLINASIANNKCPYIIAEFNLNGTIFHGVRVEYAESGFGSTNNYTFAKAVDNSSVFTMEVSTTVTIARIGSTNMTFTNAKLYY